MKTDGIGVENFWVRVIGQLSLVISHSEFQ